jgi:hypothetical protein
MASLEQCHIYNKMVNISYAAVKDGIEPTDKTASVRAMHNVYTMLRLNMSFRLS